MPVRTINHVRGVPAMNIDEGLTTQRELLAEEIGDTSRVLRQRARMIFRRLPVLIIDDPARSDGGYPPRARVAALSTDRLLLLMPADATTRPLDLGPYYRYAIVTREPGLAVDGNGPLYAVDESGSARFGPYAVRCGIGDRDIRRSYRAAVVEELSLARLTQARDVVASLRCALDEGMTGLGAGDASAIMAMDPDLLICAAISPATTDEQLQRMAALRHGRVRQAANDALARRARQPARP